MRILAPSPGRPTLEDRSLVQGHVLKLANLFQGFATPATLPRSRRLAFALLLRNGIGAARTVGAFNDGSKQ